MEMTTIENLKKVSLKVNTGSRPGSDEPNETFVFIYGVGPSGITLFEKALFGKGIGDHMEFDMSGASICESLGHLEKPLAEQTGIVSSHRLSVTITDVTQAKDRDVVRAMANGGSCSDCGCGCGGH